MQTSSLLLALVLLMCTAHALPVEPDVTSSVKEVHQNLPAGPRVEEATVAYSEIELARARRSPGGWQQGSQPQQPQPQQQQPRGSVSGSVHRERGVGTVVQAQGQGRVWTSRDGNAHVDANGHYDRVVSGPGRGRPSYGGGITYSRRW